MLPARLKNRPWTRVHVRGPWRVRPKEPRQLPAPLEFRVLPQPLLQVRFLRRSRPPLFRPGLQARLGHRRPARVLRLLRRFRGWTWIRTTAAQAPSQVLALRFQCAVQGYALGFGIEDVCHCCVLRNSLLPQPTLLAGVVSSLRLPQSDALRPLPCRAATKPKAFSTETRSGFRRTFDFRVSPWMMPGRLRHAGGRPQLTAGIRAGSYAHECTNLSTVRSIQPTAQNLPQTPRKKEITRFCRQIAVILPRTQRL
jgi:hypothetical protein